MNIELQNELIKMNEVDYIELFHCLSLAKRIRIMLRTYNKDIDWLRENLTISGGQAKEMINGASPFDLIMISNLDALELSLEMENTKTEHGEWLTFPDYIYSKKPNK